VRKSGALLPHLELQGGGSSVLGVRLSLATILHCEVGRRSAQKEDQAGGLKLYPRRQDRVRTQSQAACGSALPRPRRKIQVFRLDGSAF
jgi:hypothetical protein